VKENDEPPIGGNRNRSRQVIDLARITGNGATEFAVGKYGAASVSWARRESATAGATVAHPQTRKIEALGGVRMARVYATWPEPL